MTAAGSATPRAVATWIGHAVPEAAAVLRVSDQLIYELIQRGQLPAIELGRRRLIPRRAIDMLVDRALEGFDVDVVVAALQSTPRQSTPRQSAATGGERGPAQCLSQRPAVFSRNL